MAQKKNLLTKEEMLRSLVLNASMMFGYFIRDRRGVFSESLARRFGAASVVKDMPQWMIDQGNVSMGSVDQWRKLFAIIESGESCGSAIVSLKAEDGEFGQYWLRFDVTADDEGRPFFALITLDDFTELYQEFRTRDNNIAALLYATQSTFPEIIVFNLSRGTYRILQYHVPSSYSNPREGYIDDCVRNQMKGVAEEDQEAFSRLFLPENMRARFIEAQEKSVSLTYRRLGLDGAVYWFATTLMLLPVPLDGDITVVAASRSIDEEKARELRLAEQLRQRSEELNLTMSQMGKLLSYYDVSTSTLHTAPHVAEQIGIPPVLEDFPECLRDKVPHRYTPEKMEALHAFYTAIRRGDPTGACEYATVDTEGRNIWLRRNFATIFDLRNRPVRAVIASEDITKDRAQAEKHQQLKEQAQRNAQIFKIVAEHSNRTLYAYDLATGTTRPWDTENQKKDILAHMYTGSYSDGALDLNRYILPDCVDDVKQFFSKIHSGIPSGEVNVHVRLLDKQRRWYHFKYSSIFADSRPTTALISVEDVTVDYEQQVSHMRLLQSLEVDAEQRLSYIEADLTDDRLEKFTGVGMPEDFSANGEAYSTFLANYYFGLIAQDCIDAHAFYSRENLLSQYRQGFKHLENLWRAEKDNGSSWILIKTDLIADPISKHIKLFSYMLDVTAEQEELIAVNRRADYDSMSGLLRKEVGEDRIKARMATNDGIGGILIILDLDDLKGINDRLGHRQGDAAIIGISDALRNHFRRDDILIRAGGDEFVVFLPGAGQSVSSVELSMTALLRKLSGISIGENGERTIHCSAGCAVETPGADTYDTLFQRADTALYHVKRNGKNNFAFYVPEMSLADYEFKANQAIPVMNTAVSEDELRHLLEIVAAHYPGVILFNLSQNYFRLLSVGSNADAAPPSDTIDAFWQSASRKIHPDDLSGTLAALSRSNLLSRYALGQRRIQHYYRSLEASGCVRVAVAVDFYMTDTGDICAFLFFRWDSALGRELELLRLQKLLELTGVTDFEYICLIDVHSKSYSTFTRSTGNSHAIPEIADFDMVTKHIRDTQIPPEARDAYYESAALDRVLQHMNEPEGRYSYRYTMTDGITREAVFTWYEESHIELLMTVRRLT